MFRKAVVAVAVFALTFAVSPSAGARLDAGRYAPRREQAPGGSIPAAARLSQTGRYFVQLKAAPLSTRLAASGRSRGDVGKILRSQVDVLRMTRSLGGNVVFRYGLLVNGFSADLSWRAALSLARSPDVALVEPVPIVSLVNETSVPFIGATQVWDELDVRGEGMTVALVDTGIDYTHAAFGGPGTVEAYEANDPTVIEPGTFPTDKVIGGTDLVGENYDVLDDDPTNDVPVPDADPLDTTGHGTHTGGTCCGNGVTGAIGEGVAPESTLLAIKVWDEGNSTADVLVAGYEFALDPNGDGNIEDAADVLSFSGGVSYGTASSTEAQAAQAVVDAGIVFVASAGNEGNQPAGGSAYIVGTPATAPGVVAVAASIDEFVAQTLVVNLPAGVELPDGGIIVHQDWSAAITADITGDVVDAREVDPPADPGGDPAASDRQLCDTTPSGTPFAGKIALVFKGSTGGGDCDGSEKVFRAQEAGAIAVILWSGFGGLPFGLGPGLFVDQITIPAVMVSTADGEALGAAASPDAPGSYNTGGLNVTIDADPHVIPGFEDFMTDFTSQGPARISSALKPDISAPGFDIRSAGVGTGDGAAVLSGTSMAAPHVSGVATLLRQLHPDWSPVQIKAALMNQATQATKNNDGSEPVPASVMGSGRVQAFESAQAVSLATPASLSFGLQALAHRAVLSQSFTVWNLDSADHAYHLSQATRFSDFSGRAARVRFAGPRHFHLGPGESHVVDVQLRLDTGDIPEDLQLLGWYYVHAEIDGNVVIRQTGGESDTLHVPWHVVPLAASENHLSTSSLDLTGSGTTMTLVRPKAAGHPYADLYLLGAADEETTGGEEDVAALGARSFTGPSVDGAAEGLPSGTDPLVGLTWVEFLTNANEPTEPVEFGVQTYGVHNTTETLEVDVLIDVGADGVFADPQLQADFLVVKETGPGGVVCVHDLSAPDGLDTCSAVYFADYTNYNGSLVGLVVDASAIGLSDQNHVLSYKVIACTGVFAGDVPAQVCDEAGGFDGSTYTSRLDVIDPALVIDPLVCRGFWSGPGCGAKNPISVSVGSAQPAADPSILALFPNNANEAAGAIVTTST